MLFNGERIGTGKGVEVDVAVDPLEGTDLCARGQPNALAVVAASEKGTMFDPGPVVYMEKLACGPEVDEELDLNAPIEQTLETIARSKRVRPRDLMVVILDRPRHEEMVKRIRAVGTRIRFTAPTLSSRMTVTAQPRDRCRRCSQRTWGSRPTANTAATSTSRSKAARSAAKYPLRPRSSHSRPSGPWNHAVPVGLVRPSVRSTPLRHAATPRARSSESISGCQRRVIV